MPSERELVQTCESRFDGSSPTDPIIPRKVLILRVGGRVACRLGDCGPCWLHCRVLSTLHDTKTQE